MKKTFSRGIRRRIREEKAKIRRGQMDPQETKECIASLRQQYATGGGAKSEK